MDGDSLSHVFARIARDLLAQESVQTTLDGIAGLAAAEVEGADFAGLSVVQSGGAITTSASSDPLAGRIDAIQHECREGPCLSAIWEEGVFSVTDLSDDKRWPVFVERIDGLGIRSMLSFQLFTHRDTLGAMNLYARDADAFTDASREAGVLLATHAAVALASAQQEEHLRDALRNRQHIGEATGILIERYKITSEQAFRLLAKASQDLNIKVRKLAEELVRTGELPGAKRR